MKNKKEFTSWDHMKSNNYHWLMVMFAALTLLAFFTGEEAGVRYGVMAFFIAIGGVIIPVANYLSWKKKFGNKK